MKDVLLFLITFAVIMIAFSSGVSYIFNMASGKAKSHATLIELHSEHTNQHDFEILFIIPKSHFKSSQI